MSGFPSFHENKTPGVNLFRIIPEIPVQITQNDQNYSTAIIPKY